MKKSMMLAVGVLSLGVAVYFTSKLWAQGTPRPAATAQTRVAMLNLRWVIKNYTKYQAFMEEIKKAEEGYNQQLKAKQAQIEAKAKGIEMKSGPERERIEQDIRDIQRQAEDIKLRARKELTQKSNDEMVKVYKEVRDAAYRHAQSQGYDLVLHFEGPADKSEVDSPVLVMRNMQAGACVPLYWNPSLDISGHVLNALNSAIPARGGSTGGGSR